MEQTKAAAAAEGYGGEKRVVGGPGITLTYVVRIGLLDHWIIGFWIAGKWIPCHQDRREQDLIRVVCTSEHLHITSYYMLRALGIGKVLRGIITGYSDWLVSHPFTPARFLS